MQRFDSKSVFKLLIMRRFSNLFLIVFILCSVISFLFYWLLYLEAVTINKNDLDKDSVLNHKLEERLNALESGLKENQVVLNILNSKIRNYINKVKNGQNFLSPHRTDLCNFDKNGQLNNFVESNNVH